MKQLQGIYFYNGFNRPKKMARDINSFINDLKKNETTVTSNFLGDLSKELASELDFLLKEKHINVEDVNNVLYNYSFFYRPTIEDLQQLNINRYGLNKNEYLKELI